MSEVQQRQARWREILHIDTISRTILSALALGSVFTTAAFITIGIDMLPLLDGLHLFIMVALYGSVAMGTAHLILGFFTAVRTATAFFVGAFIDVYIMVRLGRRPKSIRTRNNARFQRIVEPSLTKRIYRIVYGLLFLSIVGLVIAVYRASWETIAALPYRQSVFYCVASLTASAMLYFIGAIYINRQASVFNSFARYSFAGGRFMTYGMAFCLGLVFVNYVKYSAPRVDVSIVGGEKLRASIVAPGANGVLMYQDGDIRVRFYPWQSIVSLQSSTPKGVR